MEVKSVFPEDYIINELPQHLKSGFLYCDLFINFYCVFLVQLAALLFLGRISIPRMPIICLLGFFNSLFPSLFFCRFVIYFYISEVEFPGAISVILPKVI